jgi:hypothetical protein
MCRVGAVKPPASADARRASCCAITAPTARVRPRRPPGYARSRERSRRHLPTALSFWVVEQSDQQTCGIRTRHTTRFPRFAAGVLGVATPFVRCPACRRARLRGEPCYCASAAGVKPAGAVLRERPRGLPLGDQLPPPAAPKRGVF